VGCTGRLRPAFRDQLVDRLGTNLHGCAPFDRERRQPGRRLPMRKTVTGKDYRPQSNWAAVNRELRRPGVTLQLLPWEEQGAVHPTARAGSRELGLRHRRSSPVTGDCQDALRRYGLRRANAASKKNRLTAGYAHAPAAIIHARSRQPLRQVRATPGPAARANVWLPRRCRARTGVVAQPSRQSCRVA
jgi:hypothetical protein